MFCRFLRCRIRALHTQFNTGVPVDRVEMLPSGAMHGHLSRSAGDTGRTCGWKRILLADRNAVGNDAVDSLVERTANGRRATRQEERIKELRELARSAHHLMVFEAAARNQSFTTAAHELEVKPGTGRTIRPVPVNPRRESVSRSSTSA